jgi:hypothetical protein
VKKLILAPVALFIGLGAGTIVTVVRYEPPPAPPAPDSLETPPLAASEKPARDRPATALDTAGATMEAFEIVATPAGAAPTGPAVGALPLPDPAPVPRPTGGAGTTAAAGDTNETGATQLGRIFAAMQPRDAAMVLAYLSDQEMERILVAMPARQAAAVLTNLEPDRAARLSRAVLAGGNQ